MTMDKWLHYQRLLAYYEEEQSCSNMKASLCLAAMGLCGLIGIFLASMQVSIWWIVVAPAFMFLCAGITQMCNASYAKDMIETIKWRMI